MSEPKQGPQVTVGFLCAFVALVTIAMIAIGQCSRLTNYANDFQRRCRQAGGTVINDRCWSEVRL